MAAKFNVAEIIIAKQRHGPIGRVDVGFNPARVRFSNLEHSRSDSRVPVTAGAAGFSGRGFLPDGEE